jgi:hypothetical protein
MHEQDRRRSRLSRFRDPESHAVSEDRAPNANVGFARRKDLVDADPPA